MALASLYSLKLLLFFSYFLYLNILTFSSTTSTFPPEALPTKSGYLPVKPESSSSIFYIFYEAQKPILPLSETPLLFWLQGGPGCSSMVGNFLELGPWRVIPRTQNSVPISLKKNPGSWNRIFGLVFLDNPIGTGFSIASTPEEIPRDQRSIAEHLFSAITGFIDLDPEFKSRPVYITGESYAGKYIPAIGYYILKKNKHLPVSKRVNLAGVAIGDGLTDPVTQVKTHAVTAYYCGLINQRQKEEVEKVQLEAVSLARSGNWSKATNARQRVFKTLENMTGLATLLDFTKKVPYQTNLVTKFLKQNEVKKALGVKEGVVYKYCSNVVKKALHEDGMKSAKHMAQYVVKNSKVLMFQGNFDLRDGVVQVEAWVKTMKWEGIEEFLRADRKIWKVNGELAGYVQKWKSLTNVVVLGAGHLLPADQGVNSQAMIEDWILEKGLFRNVQELELSSKPWNSV